LVLVIGVKLVIEGFEFENVDFHSSANAAFWIFWASMLLSLASGFRPRKRDRQAKKFEQTMAEEVKISDDIL
jgi:predicted tellurium resistance membrane protein TerC